MKNRIINLLSITSLGRLILFSFSKTFTQEFKESLQAKKLFHRNKNIKSNIFLLRRNLHRLEKGLCSPKRKDFFAKEYIESTVFNFIGLYSDKLFTDKYENDLLYAHQILSKYFSVVTQTEQIVKLKKLFEKATSNHNALTNSLVPYKFKKLSEIELISYYQFESLIKRRRSIRYYENKKVLNSDIEKAVKHAKFSPSPCNRYSVRYHCISNKKLIKQVGSIVGGAKSFIDNVPKLIAITSLSSAYEGLYDRHATYIDASLSLMTLVYSLETLGLNSCVINWPKIPINDFKARELLNLDPSENVIMLLSVGYADLNGMVPFSQKVSNKTLIKYYD
tara:strand:- start:9847 stop:10851 length:1005 start_codon:yes stop_codon:yes gene_type:complete